MHWSSPPVRSITVLQCRTHWQITEVPCFIWVVCSSQAIPSGSLTNKFFSLLWSRSPQTDTQTQAQTAQFCMAIELFIQWAEWAVGAGETVKTISRWRGKESSKWQQTNSKHILKKWHCVAHFSRGSYACGISLCLSNFQVLLTWSSWFSKRLIFSAFMHGFYWKSLKTNILFRYFIVVFKYWQRRRAKQPGIWPHRPRSPAWPVWWKPKRLF